nr:MAG TPA: antirestriction protein [Caudoviricetes sp.]
MKRLVEDFDDMMKVEDEVSVEDAKSPLEKELIRVYEYLKDKGETDIKEYETAYQEAIEKIYPENLWWEVIDLNIFWDLFENQNPRATIDNIISSVKPEFKKEVIDTVVADDIEEENPEISEPLDESKKVCEDTVKQGNKWVNKGKDGTHGTFKTKKAADAQRKAMFANKGKKSTFGEGFEVGDTFTNAGAEWTVLRSAGNYSLLYSKDRKFQPYVVAYRLDDDGTWGQGHYFSDKSDAVTFLMNEVETMRESKQRRRRNHRVTEAEQEKLSKKQRVKRIYESMKRKPKKNLKEAADDEIKLFMNTWSNYNEHGADGVITPTGWMSLDEAEEYADKYEEYEPFINDTDNVPEELGVNEYSDISETVDMLRRYEAFDDTQKEVFAALIDDGYEEDKAFDIVDDNDYYYVEGDDDAELAENYIDELGGIEELGRDILERYFDYERYGRDLAFDFIKTDSGYVSYD